ncbi:MAG TPA: hypothetical protein PLO61_00515 [Fimbriimonadaceae bacterium]|nr:hypothetical protein [Fimbriimonadaceae bacterium]HRJ32380.1 hypothetical protein [Fimbriimonadaceae bacterium]
MFKKDGLRGFRFWFLAAALYNVVWGVAVIFFPGAIFEAVGIAAPNYPSLFQCIGMMVMVYALGYWYLAIDPIRFAPFVWIGLLGKTFGPLGFLMAAAQGELPWAFGWTIVLNDLIWWPAFWAFAWRYARQPISPSPEPPA